MPKLTRRAVYRAIDSERAYQERAWPTSAVLSVGDEILLLEEYLAKARAAWAREPAPETEALDVLRKVAGIAVRCMENHGTVERL